MTTETEKKHIETAIKKEMIKIVLALLTENDQAKKEALINKDAYHALKPVVDLYCHTNEEVFFAGFVAGNIVSPGIKIT